MTDDPLAVDHKGDASVEEAEGLWHAEGGADLALGVCEDAEGQAVAGGEGPVRVDAVGRDPDHLRARLLEVREVVAEGAGLGGAARGVVLGIEVDDDAPLLPELGGRDVIAVLVREGELRGSLADGEELLSGGQGRVHGTQHT